MATPVAKSKYTLIDFTRESLTPCFATTTAAVATSADNQVDFTRINGHLIDWIQTGAAGTAIMPVVQTAAPFGWLLPNLDGGTANSVEMGEGRLVSGNVPYKSFTIGTDPAFFVRARLCVLGNIDNVTAAVVGFRDDAAQADVVNAAALVTAYTNTAYVGIGTTAGAMKSFTQAGATTATTSATHAAWTVAGTAVTGIDFKVLVSAAGVVTYQIDGASDALLAAASYTFANATVVVPAIHAIVANGTGAVEGPVVIQEYECGYQ